MNLDPFTVGEGHVATWHAGSCICQAIFPEDALRLRIAIPLKIIHRRDTGEPLRHAMACVIIAPLGRYPEQPSDAAHSVAAKGDEDHEGC